jgi:hypothetical protein
MGSDRTCQARERARELCEPSAMRRPSRKAITIDARSIHAGRVLLALSLCAWVCACDGPIGPLPGGRLRGEESPCPDDFRAFASEREVELEISPDAPRSVRIWNVVQDGRLFVPGDFLTPIKRWPHQVMLDSRVRVRIAGKLFRCTARRLGDAALIDSLRRETARKYALEPDGWAARSEVWWFELVPRDDDLLIRASETR